MLGVDGLYFSGAAPWSGPSAVFSAVILVGVVARLARVSSSPIGVSASHWSRCLAAYARASFLAMIAATSKSRPSREAQNCIWIGSAMPVYSMISLGVSR